ncbi:MAG: carbon-nitrogen hydrolase family protein [Planctomycetes bacterium]|nr:carbon-nitrogen hydrolase family protein [Planctomycetota bacterium]
MRLAVLHFTPELGAVERNRARLLAALEAAADADLLVLPELATTGFAMTPAQAQAWVEPLEGETTSALRRWAAETKTVVACGLALREGEQLFNAQVLIESTGEIRHVYRKRHLWGHDRGWATPGEEPGALTETSLGGVAQLICADIGHLETVLALAQRRPRFVAFSTAWVGEGEPFPTSWQVALRLFDPAPILIANRGGEEEGIEFADPSAILAYRGGGVVGARGVEPQLLWWIEPER